jgi:hypothetical protein
MQAVYSQTIKSYLIHTTASYHVFCNEHTFQRVCMSFIVNFLRVQQTAQVWIFAIGKPKNLAKQ